MVVLNDVEEKLYPMLPEIMRYFGTPFIIYDEAGILTTGNGLKAAFREIGETYGFREYFAVKANPIPRILRMMYHLGFGLDCSSKPELTLAREAGFSGEEIMFSSNDTNRDEFEKALAEDGCILNLDDITMVPKVPEPFPKLICFRYNPGKSRPGNMIIGPPEEAKYGIRPDQAVEAYRQAKERGAERFGLHTMIVSNQLDYTYMVETVKMLLEAVETISSSLGITFEFINIGGGIGVPYWPGQKPFDVEGLARGAKDLLDDFKQKYEYAPRLLMECGRIITGPHGFLIAPVINRMSKHRELVGVKASMADFMRPGMYGKDAYHDILILDGEGRPKEGPTEIVDVSGPLCEGCDKFAIQRELPVSKDGDIMVLKDAGAHGRAMGFNYNGRLRCQSLLLRKDGKVELIQRAETEKDYFTTFHFEPKIYSEKEA